MRIRIVGGGCGGDHKSLNAGGFLTTGATKTTGTTFNAHRYTLSFVGDIMIHYSRFVFLALAGICVAGTPVKVGSERRLSFNQDWRFFKGEAAGARHPASPTRNGSTYACRERLGYRGSV